MKTPGTPFPRVLVLALVPVMVTACAGNSPQRDDAENAAVLERLARMERAMNRLGVTLEGLERDLKAVQAPAPASGDPPTPSLAGKHYGIAPVPDRDCDRGGWPRHVNAGRSFSTW